MKNHTHSLSHEAGSLTENARALVAATSDAAGEKVAEARKRLITAIESSKEMAVNVRDKAVAGAKATDRMVQANPYKSIAIALGVGVLAGAILAGRAKHKTA